MKHLFICRHAKSSWDHPSLPDFDRPLSERGLFDASVMAQRLVDRGIHPDLICASPAERARKTAEIYADAIGYPLAEISFKQRLYSASASRLLTLLQEIAPSVETLMLVGHNPECTQLAKLLGDTTVDEISSGGMVALDLAVSLWSQVNPHCGSLIFFDSPKKNTE